MPKPRRAVIYTRISDDKEGRELGVARQEDDCREIAKAEELSVVEVYSDNDVSASTNSRTARPGWDRLLADGEAGRYDVILAYSTSRLTRRPREAEDIIDLHDDFGIGLVLRGHRPDLSAADGRHLFRILCGMDTGEAERTSERVRRKHLELAESGRHNGPRPFGWDIVGKGSNQRLVVNDAEAAVLRELVARALAGDGLWKLCLDLNARGIRTSTGRPWQTQVLRRVLLRDRNYGYRKHQPTKRGKHVGPQRLYPGAWDPIIDSETHERVVAMLTDPARKTNNRGTAPKYMLTSVAYCGECGGHVVGTSEYTYEVKGSLRQDGTRGPVRTRIYPHTYRCPHPACHAVTRRMADVDDHVSRVVIALLVRDGVTLLGGDPAAADSARMRIAELEAKMKIAADRFVSGEWTDDMVSRITAQVRPQWEAEKQRLLGAQPADSSLDAFTGPSAAEAWKSADVETKKRIIRLLRMRITIKRVGSGNGRDYDPASVTITPE